jgi:hypothetical protein
MNAKQIIQKALNDNPEIRLVLEIAARARFTEGDTAVDLTSKNEVVTVPNNQQFFPLHS